MDESHHKEDFKCYICNEGLQNLKDQNYPCRPFKTVEYREETGKNYVPNNDVFRPATILLITVYQQTFKHTESKYTRYSLEKHPIKLLKICIRFLFLRKGGGGVFKLAMMFAYIHSNIFIRIMTHYFEY